MKLNKKTAEFFIPDNKDIETAIKRTTHMSIAAHQDDIEIFVNRFLEYKRSQL